MLYAACTWVVNNIVPGALGSVGLEGPLASDDLKGLRGTALCATVGVASAGRSGLISPVDGSTATRRFTFFSRSWVAVAHSLDFFLDGTLCVHKL